MNREIKLRFWITPENRMIISVGHCFESLTHIRIWYRKWLPSEQDYMLCNESFNVSNVESLQFTGLTDKNGNEIFEGHVLRDKEGIGVVYFYPPQFVVQTQEETPFALGGGDVNRKQLTGAEIIGNIFENPDLLK